VVEQYPNPNAVPANTISWRGVPLRGGKILQIGGLQIANCELNGNNGQFL
jgi:hypothetical protein